MALDGRQPNRPLGGDKMTRLAVCAVVAVAVIYAVEKLCEGKDIPLWKQYGPWIQQNQVQAVAVLAAVLYGASLALWPEALPAKKEEEPGFTPCE